MKLPLLIVGLLMLIFIASLLPTGKRALGPIENIHGILYPSTPAVAGQAGLGQAPILITESLAHADIYLKEPVLAKQLELTLTYRPINLTSLAVGVREDSFWLSYGSKQETYRAGNTPGVELAAPAVALREGWASSPGVKEARIVIPLTDKLQETDRSLDLMFFAEGEGIQWELHDLSARVTYAWPAYHQFRNYVGSVLKQERAL